MSENELVSATSGGQREMFALNWYSHRWTSAVAHDFADYPFIAEIRGKRYEVYSDGTFDEEEVSKNS